MQGGMEKAVLCRELKEITLMWVGSPRIPPPPSYSNEIGSLPEFYRGFGLSTAVMPGRAFIKGAKLKITEELRLTQSNQEFLSLTIRILVRLTWGII